MALADVLYRFTYTLLHSCCVLCGGRGRPYLDICNACEADLPWVTRPCPVCSLPTESGGLCAECLTTRRQFSAAICPFSYRFPVDILIQRFKQQQHLASGRVLAELLASCAAGQLRQLDLQDALVAPVPLHKRKQRKRGFNQAALIAEPVSRVLGASPAPGLLSRTMETPEQKTLSLGDRRKNLRGAFQCNEPIKDRRILLVDDVITTTSTVSEITRVLFDAGAADVIVLAVARTPVATA